MEKTPTGFPEVERANKRIVTFVTLNVLLLVLIRTAWVSDDAYITFRTIDNLFHGYGLRWNIAERVQAYTHPLWMLVVGTVYGLTSEPYYTSLAISMALTVTAAYLLVHRVSRDIPAAVAASMILILSKAFIDYSTSGLENPLTHFLLVMFFVVYFSASSGPRRVFVLALLTAFLAINHSDTVLLVLPAVGTIAWRERSRPTLIALIAGCAPVVAWEAFSMVYYGFPLPNTAYAKLLRTGIPASESIPQGLIYLLDSVNGDPLTLTTIVGASLFTLLIGMSDAFPIVVGIGLYLAYVVRIGGDFMSGRLLAAPLLCGAVIVSRVETSRFGTRIGTLVYVALAALGIMSPRPTVFSSAQDGAGVPVPIAASGIADERLVYYQETGLLNVTRAKGHDGGRVKSPASEGLLAPGHHRRVEELSAVGLHGYYAGPDVHVIDQLALADPLLARLPAGTNWRPGHFFRGVPEGYRETLESGVNHLQNPGLAAFYNELSIITRGPVFSRRRFRTIVRMNLGAYDTLLTQPSP